MLSQDLSDELARAAREFEPRWPRYAQEWNKIKPSFSEEVQADWARFLVETAKPTTMKFWFYGINFLLLGEDLTDEPGSGVPTRE